MHAALREVITLPPNSTLTSHTPLLLARPRQKTLRQAQTPFAQPMEKNMDTITTLILGTVVATPGALDALTEARESALGFLARHASGDWGEIPPEDREENEFSIKNEFRILSAYSLRNGTKIWIITEADRSVTTILLPCEY
jgi:hypothetical protein